MDGHFTEKDAMQQQRKKEKGKVKKR